MSEEKIVESEVVETPTEAPETENVEAEQKPTSSEEKKKATSATLKDAWKQVESFGQTLSEALQGRGNVVMVRINDEALAHLDMLVDAEITKSRSESAAFLINEGINANAELFKRISNITEQIAELREKLRKEVSLDVE